MEAFLATKKEGKPFGQGRTQADAGKIGEEGRDSSRKQRVCKEKAAPALLTAAREGARRGKRCRKRERKSLTCDTAPPYKPRRRTPVTFGPGTYSSASHGRPSVSLT